MVRKISFAYSLLNLRHTIHIFWLVFPCPLSLQTVTYVSLHTTKQGSLQIWRRETPSRVM